MEQVILNELKTISILSFERTCNLHLVWYSLFKRKNILINNFLNLIKTHKKILVSDSNKQEIPDLEFLEEIKLLEQLDSLLIIISGNKESIFSQKKIIKNILNESKSLKKSINNKISFTCKELIKYQNKILLNYNKFLTDQEKVLKIIKKNLLNKKKNFGSILEDIDKFHKTAEEEMKFLNLFHKKSLDFRNNSIKNLTINTNLLKSKLKELKRNKILFHKKDSIMHLDLKANNILQQYLGLYLNYLFEFYIFSGFIIINPHFKINDNFNKSFSNFKDLMLVYLLTVKKHFNISKKVSTDLTKIINLNRKLQKEFITDY
jgi:hypothetical protein